MGTDLALLMSAVVTVNATSFLRASPSAIVSFLQEQLKRRALQRPHVPPR